MRAPINSFINAGLFSILAGLVVGCQGDETPAPEATPGYVRPAPIDEHVEPPEPPPGTMPKIVGTSWVADDPGAAFERVVFSRSATAILIRDAEDYVTLRADTSASAESCLGVPTCIVAGNDENPAQPLFPWRDDQTLTFADCIALETVERPDPELVEEATGMRVLAITDRALCLGNPAERYRLTVDAPQAAARQ